MFLIRSMTNMRQPQKWSDLERSNPDDKRFSEIAYLLNWSMISSGRSENDQKYYLNGKSRAIKKGFPTSFQLVNPERDARLITASQGLMFQFCTNCTPSVDSYGKKVASAMSARLPRSECDSNQNSRFPVCSRTFRQLSLDLYPPARLHLGTPPGARWESSVANRDSLPFERSRHSAEWQALRG